MNLKNYQNTAFEKSLFIASGIIIIAGVMAAKAIIVPILLALFLSIICIQPIELLQRYKIPYSVAMVIVIIAIGLIMLIFAHIVGRSISAFIADLPKYDERLKHITVALVYTLNKFGADINPQQLLSFIDPAQVLNYTAETISKAGKVLSNSFVIILLMVFMLLEAKILALKTAVLEKTFKSSMKYLDKIGVSIRHYLSIKTYISVLTGLFIGLWLWAFGVDYPILWGLISFLLNYIPSIGSILAAIPTILLALVQLGFGGMIWVVIGYLIVNIVVGNMIEPKVMGKGLGLSTLTVFLSLIVWGFILGTVGMFLSIPLTITAKIMLEQNSQTRWIAILLGTEREATQMLTDQESA